MIRTTLLSFAKIAEVNDISSCACCNFALDDAWAWPRNTALLQVKCKLLYNLNDGLAFVLHIIVGASLSEPHTGQTASPAIYDLCIVRHSVNKCPPCSNSLDSFDFACVINSVKCRHIQIIETASILQVQWAYVLDNDENDTTQLGHFISH